MEPGQPHPSASARQRALQQAFRRLPGRSMARDGVLFLPRLRVVLEAPAGGEGGRLDAVGFLREGWGVGE